MTTVARPPIEVGIADKSPLVLAALKGLLGQTDRFSLTVAASDGERFLEAVRRLHFDVGDHRLGHALSRRPRGAGGAARTSPAARASSSTRATPTPRCPAAPWPWGRPPSSPSARRPSGCSTRSRPWRAARWCSRSSTSAASTTIRLDTLSPRERELLAELGSGRTNAELARNLGVSVNTVKFHLRNLFDKLQVRSRAQAVQLWHESRR